MHEKYHIRYIGYINITNRQNSITKKRRTVTSDFIANYIINLLLKIDRERISLFIKKRKQNIGRR